MVTIVNYRERYQSDLEKLQPEMARELRMHPDVVRETACVALSDGVFIGAGFLAEANPYRVDAGDEQVRYLRAEFTVLPGCDEEAEASYKEAVDIRRKLADAQPDAFLPDRLEDARDALSSLTRDSAWAT